MPEDEQTTCEDCGEADGRPISTGRFAGRKEILCSGCVASRARDHLDQAEVEDDDGS